MDENGHLKVIEDISKNARTTWVSLLVTLIFCAITLLSVSDRDFFEYGAQTKLPLVGVSVPVVGFFWSAPVLILALYLHLHIYLSRLWRALAAAREDCNERIDDRVYPWLLSDTALSLDLFERPRDDPVRSRDFLFLMAGVSFLLGWLSTPTIMAMFWIRSWAYHDTFLTMVLGLLSVASTVMGVLSYLKTREFATRNRESEREGPSPRFYRSPLVPAVLMAGFCVGLFSYARTDGIRGNFIYAANLYRIDFVRVPPNWENREIAWEDHVVDGGGADELNILGLQKGFEKRRRYLVLGLPKDDWPHIDLQKADMREANLPGVDMNGARMDGADLTDALMENIDLTDARLVGAALVRAQLGGALLTGADLDEADLSGAKAEGATFEGATLDGAILNDARLRMAILSGATMVGARLVTAQMDHAFFVKADMTRARLDGARLEGADLTRAILSGARLIGAEMRDATFDHAELDSAVLSDAQMPGASFRHARMRGVDMVSATLPRADLTFAAMQNALFGRAELRRVDFTESYLKGADFFRANVTLATFRGAMVAGADLSEAVGLSQDQLDGTLGDYGTKIPDALTRPQHWLRATLSDENALSEWRNWIRARRSVGPH